MPSTPSNSTCLTLVRSVAAEARLERARSWLRARAPAEEVLIVAATPDAANELLRTVAQERGAAFGWHRATLGRLAAGLAEHALVEEGLVPVGALVAEAVVARIVHAARREGSLGRYAEVADGPGFARAICGVLQELRHAQLDAQRVPTDLRSLFTAFDAQLREAGLADRASVLSLGTRAAADAKRAHPLLGLPTLLLDVAVHTAAERALVLALVGRAPEVLATVPEGDARTLRSLESFEVEVLSAVDAGAAGSLSKLQTHLFEESSPEEAPLGEDVVLLSAPGESRECVEIARRLRRFGRAGIRFDRMAVLLRSPEEYRPHLEEALARAEIPAHFAVGAVQPDPSGRAFLALLGCAAEGLSARRFAEYLSLGEVPDAGAEGAPPPSAPAADRWVAPDEELVPEAVQVALTTPRGSPEEELEEALSHGDAPELAPVTAGTLRAPRRWERLLNDAAVIGGEERWQRRLEGLEHELHLDLEELEDPEAPAAERLRRQLADLRALHGYALPLVGALAQLPEEASWEAWLDALSALATSALRRPERVLGVLAELAPMASVGPVTLAEVRLVLGRRLLELAIPAGGSRYGKVFVAPVEAARGLAFDVVCVPGLAEKIFPGQISEEPILLDAVRAELGGALLVNDDRIGRERLALRLAAGVARQHLLLSYPRIDLEKSRPRVPSFYALEALRAAEGRLPSFDLLASRAERVADTRLGWPAPSDPRDAIDEAEHDLALLDSLRRLDSEKSVGTARYLLEANPHLGRALRFRARRWLESWTRADGLLETAAARKSGSPDLHPGAREALRAHQLGARSYSPTALQNFSACPYKFFLYAIHRLAPREVPEAIDALDPLQKGSLVHDVQFELYGCLGEAGLLPVTPDNLQQVREILDEVLNGVSARYHDNLAPAIERVWQDGVAGIRADLREWLRVVSEDESGFVPWRFELAFGLPGRRERDPHSVPSAVPLDCGISLRGSIDLVERGDSERVRVTDHKTGRVRVKNGTVIAGGESLQPVLYALAAEKIFEGAQVEVGRLFYCTSVGGFAERNVPLDAEARSSAVAVAEAVGGAVEAPFLPAAPAEGACRWCDYRVVCGPYEEQRTERKWQGEKLLEPLQRLRELP